MQGHQSHGWAFADLVESLPPTAPPGALAHLQHPRQAGASGTGRCEFWPG